MVGCQGAACDGACFFDFANLSYLMDLCGLTRPGVLLIWVASAAFARFLPSKTVRKLAKTCTVAGVEPHYKRVSQPYRRPCMPEAPVLADRRSFCAPKPALAAEKPCKSGGFSAGKGLGGAVVRAEAGTGCGRRCLACYPSDPELRVSSKPSTKATSSLRL